MPRLLIPLIVLSTALIGHADIRPWKTADGARTVLGEFVKRDDKSVTLKINGGTETTVDFTKLHPDEKAWVDKNHPLGGPDGGKPPANAFFDTLTFDDTRDTVMAKLKASKIVAMVSDEIFAGRSGLNALFRTRSKVGKLDCFLFFEWTEAGKLQELSLQTDKVAGSAYKSDFEPSWTALVELITTLYGEPVHGSPLPKMETLKDGSFMPSHLWKLKTGGSILLGTGREGDKYQMVVRFTKDKIEPVAAP